MKKLRNRGMSLVLACIMLITVATPLGTFAGATDEPVDSLDVLDYAEKVRAVGTGYEVVQDKNGLTITLTEDHYGIGDYPTSCNDLSVREIINPGSYSHMLMGQGNENYVAIPVNQLFDVANNQDLALQIKAAEENSDYAGTSFAIWYEAYLDSGERYCSGRYLANIQEYLGGQVAIDDYGNYFGQDITYSGTEFFDYMVEKGRTNQFKITAVILKVVGEKGDSFTFTQLNFGKIQAPEEEKTWVYNFGVLYDLFRTGTHPDGNWHSSANLDENITYDRVSEYNAGFKTYVIDGGSNYATSNYRIALPENELAEWCYDSKSADPSMNTSNKNKDVGVMMTPSGAWISFRIKIAEDGEYTAASAMRFQPDSGLVDVYLTQAVLPDERLSEERRIDRVDTYRASGGVQSELREHKKGIMLRAGEYILSYKLAGNSTQENAPQQVWAGVGGFALTRTGKYYGSADTVEIPVASPLPGTYIGAQKVTLSCKTAGANIYYTMDGTDPDASSTQYTAPIIVDEDVTIKAIAISETGKSSIASFVYNIEGAPTRQVYNFAVLYDFFNTGDYSSSWHSRINIDSAITYDAVRTYNEKFTQYVTNGGSGSAASNYGSAVPKTDLAEWCYDTQSESPRMDTSNCNKDVGIMMTPSGAWLSLRIRVAADGAYTASSGMRFQTDSGIVDVYLTPSSLSDERLSEERRIDRVDTYRASNVTQSEMREHSADIMLRAGEYILTYKLAGNSTQTGASIQTWAGVSGFVLNRTGDYIESSDTIEFPVATPNAGNYESAQEVTLSTQTEGAEIYYTTDGTDPVENGIKYENPIIVDKTTTIQTVAIKDTAKSATATYQYIIEPKEVHEYSVFNFATMYEFFYTGDYGAAGWHNREDLDQYTTYDAVEKYNQGFEACIINRNSPYAASNYSIPLPKEGLSAWCFDSQSATPKMTTSNKNKDVGIMMTPSGAWLSFRIQVKKDGAYTASSAMRFQPDSGLVAVYLTPVSLVNEKMSQEYLIDTVDTYRAENGIQSEMHEHADNIMLRAGEYYLTYKLAGNSTQTGAASQVWAGVGGFVLDRTGDYVAGTDRLELPIANPAPGSYTEQQQIVLTNPADGAAIYFTTDGSEPTENSSVYTSPIPVNETTTIKAFAAKSGIESSKIATLVYEINLPPVKLAKPTASVESGTVFQDTLEVSFHTEETDAVIYYTTTGMPPTTSSTKYTGPITISKTTTFRVIVTKKGMEASDAASFVYEKEGQTKVPAPAILPETQTFTNSIDITFACAEEGAKIYYTTNGTVPTAGSSLYDGTPVYLSQSTCINAIAIKDGMLDSDVSTAIFTKEASSISSGGGGSSSGGFSSTQKRQTAAPTSSVSSGVYAEAQTVVLSCQTQGAVIYYTTDGSTPTASSTKYTGAILVDSDMKICVVAVKSGMDSSPVLTLEFTIKKSENNVDVGESTDPDIVNPFRDISEDDWFFKAAIFANEKGIMKGIAADTFAPRDVMTRGMFITILYRMSGGSMQEYGENFTDVKSDDWFASGISWGSAAGVAKGMGNDKFMPNAAITREQLCVMLMRYIRYAGITLPTNSAQQDYSDAEYISAWAKEDIAALTSAGIIQGNSQKEFNPQGNATRAEVATIIYRLSQIEDLEN